jgi:hypothetical protein
VEHAVVSEDRQVRSGWHVATTVVGLAVTAVLTSGCEPGDGADRTPGSYRPREDGIALRTGGASCAASPGRRTCPEVLLGLTTRQRVFPLCQRRGELVGSNSWWLYADGPRGTRGWVSSWFLDHPTNKLPGVPDCTSAHIRPRGT